jgi:hypothetical protein
MGILTLNCFDPLDNLDRIHPRICDHKDVSSPRYRNQAVDFGIIFFYLFYSLVRVDLDAVESAFFVCCHDHALVPYY